MVEAKLSKISMHPGYPNVQQKEEDSMPNCERYRSLGSALLYVAVCTRPDISIAASIAGSNVSKAFRGLKTRVPLYGLSCLLFNIALDGDMKRTDCNMKMGTTFANPVHMLR